MICEVCLKRPAEHLHHKFPQTKINKNLYKDFIHHEKNILKVCSICHLSKPIPKYNEIEFCASMGIMPRSKIARAWR
jgi:hypothetical protein